MANAHIGHDAQLGHHNTISNGVSVAGHVHWYSDGFEWSLRHPSIRAHWRPCLRVRQCNGESDVPPFCSASGDRAKLYGLNTVGLRRAGLTPDIRRRLHGIYRQLFVTDRPKWRVYAHTLLSDPDPHVVSLAKFCLGTQRGLLASVRNADIAVDSQAEAVDTD